LLDFNIGDAWFFYSVGAYDEVSDGDTEATKRQPGILSVALRRLLLLVARWRTHRQA